MQSQTFTKRTRLLLTIIAAAALSACGGGSGGPSTGDSSGGTGGGGSTGGGTNAASGTFIDNPVNGLEYEGGPSGTSGITGDNGTDGGFTVESGDTVTFSLGGLVLGTSDTVTGNSRIITPAELAGDPENFNNPVAIRIAQLLQSLDSDRDTSNGIDIPAAVITRLSDGTVNASTLRAAIEGDGDFEAVLGGVIDELTAGGANRAEGEIVSASVAKAELAAAVARATGGSAPGVTGGTPIVAAEVADCPAGVASTNRVDIFGQSFPICVLSSDITSNTTLTNDHVYVLESAINVGNGNRAGGPTQSAILTLEPGTQVFGYNGLQTGLVITRGSQIQAVGDADRPIIMAAVEASGTGNSVRITDDPTDLSKRGQWAGLVLSGSGINNQCSGGGATEVESEAVPTGAQRFFGCSNNADSSGTVEYVIIAESGLGFRPDQEVQGLTIEAAGSGTRINFLQVLGSEDDGIEWFGGAASVSNVVINGADDDSLDFDEGHVGTIQTALVIQGAENGDRGIEADNAGPDDDATPVTRPNFVNLTILGNQGSEDDTKGMLWRRGFGGEVFRGAILDNSAASSGTGQFKRGCLDIDDQIDTNTAFRDVAVGCANGTGPADAEGDGDGLETSFATGGADESGGAVSGDRRDFTNIADPGAALNTTTLAVTVGEDPDNSAPLPAAVNGFSANDWFGAVDPESGNPDGNPNNNGSGGGPFWDGWTYINSGVDGGLPGSNFHPLQDEIQ